MTLIVLTPSSFPWPQQHAETIKVIANSMQITHRTGHSLQEEGCRLTRSIHGTHASNRQKPVCKRKWYIYEIWLDIFLHAEVVQAQVHVCPVLKGRMRKLTRGARVVFKTPCRHLSAQSELTSADSSNTSRGFDKEKKKKKKKKILGRHPVAEEDNQNLQVIHSLLVSNNGRSQFGLYSTHLPVKQHEFACFCSRLNHKMRFLYSQHGCHRDSII